MRKRNICALEECNQFAHGNGYCLLHYSRLRNTGRFDLPTVSERFWAKVNKSGECWEWMGYKTPLGYGRYTVYSPEGKRNTTAHRFSYEERFGTVDRALQVDHKCHNRSCVNPSHLRLATNKQNNENRSGAQKNSSSGVRGVYRNKEGTKWYASVKHHGKRYYLGGFDDLAEAEAAVVAKRLELFTHNLLDRKAS